MKLMSDKRAASMREEYEKLSELEQRRVKRIMIDSAAVATPGKQIAVLASGILSIAIMVVFLRIELLLFQHQSYMLAIMFLFPMLLLLSGVFGIYYMFRIKRRTTLEGATECLLQEKKFNKRRQRNGTIK